MQHRNVSATISLHQQLANMQPVKTEEWCISVGQHLLFACTKDPKVDPQC